MAELTISQVGRRVGLRPSAIRYYEQIGIIAPAARRHGQRRYDDRAVHNLMVVQRARGLGFSLTEIRTLFSFPADVAAAPRWATLASARRDQLRQTLEALTQQLARLDHEGQCGCATLEECGRCIMESRV
jgi:MerR family redox-sensitive transcriptional activator SoxR